MHFRTATWLLLVVITLFSKTHARRHKCDHPYKDTEYPPDVPHLVLEPAYVDQFDEVLVIGDVHACLDELKLLLKESNTEGDNVLKILTGDITRKGPDSLGVIRFVRDNPSMLTVRGNNDQKILSRYLKKQNNSTYRYKAADKFIDDMTDEDMDFVKQLPYTISIPSLNAIVVHGGIQPGKELADQQPYDLMNMRNLVRAKYCPNKYRPYNGEKKGLRWATVWRGPQFVYFGHDHPRNLQITPFAVGVDTSCVYGDYLTGIFIKGPRKDEFVRVRALNQYFSH